MLTDIQMLLLLLHITVGLRLLSENKLQGVAA
jgi:hypothetical protein